MSDSIPIADLLQALEGVIETNERVCTALPQCFDAHQQGRVLSAAVLKDYSRQLESVISDQKRVR